MLAEARESPLCIRFNYLVSRFQDQEFLEVWQSSIKSFENLESISLNQRLRITACQTVPIFKRLRLNLLKIVLHALLPPIYISFP